MRPQAAAECGHHQIHRGYRVACRHQRAFGRRFGAGRSSGQQPQCFRRSSRVVPFIAAQSHPCQGAQGPRGIQEGTDTAAAAALAKTAEVAIVFVNQPASESSDLPQCVCNANTAIFRASSNVSAMPTMPMAREELKYRPSSFLSTDE